jgi:hypothetical protein
LYKSHKQQIKVLRNLEFPLTAIIDITRRVKKRAHKKLQSKA